MEFLLDMISNYQSAATDVTKQSGGHVSNVRQDPHYARAEHSLRTLLERFANNSSMDPIIRAVDDIYKAARQDDDLRAWFKELDSYVRNVLLEPGYVMDEESDREGRRIRENGKGVFLIMLVEPF